MSPHEASTTLSLAVAVGALLIALADRLRMPSIVLLLVGGILLGPEVVGLIQPDSLGAGLELVVTLAVAVVLFEGGLTLDTGGFQRERVLILRMLTLGVLITWGGATLAAIYFFGMEPELGAVAGSLLVVTGPTVISPLLRRMHLQPRLHHVLYSESVLIDAVGVFFAVLCFEWVLASGEGAVIASLARFGLRFLVGGGIGIVVGFSLALAMRREWVSLRHVNVVVAGAVLLAFAGANALLSESGILAVIGAGVVLRMSGSPGLKSLKRFKLELTELAIGLLFVLLSARLDLGALLAMGPPLLGFVLVVLLLRPVNIFFSSWGQALSLRERAFLSWLAPRGIVAASMASLFSIRLEEMGVSQATLLEPLTFAVIASTVIVQGLSSPSVARWLKLTTAPGGTWMLIGDAAMAVELHRKLHQAGGRSLVLAAPGELVVSRNEVVEAVISQSFDPGVLNESVAREVEAIIALSERPEVNDLICELWTPMVGAAACYRWDRGSGATPKSGTSIWEQLPGPDRVRAAVEEGRSAFDTVEGEAEVHKRDVGSREQVLLAVEKGRISVAGRSAEGGGAGSVVVLRDRIPGLAGLIRGATIVDRATITRREVFSELLHLAARDLPKMDPGACLELLEERERTMASAIGGGVAIPHLYMEGIAESRCYAARVGPSAAILGPDARPLSLVFLVLSSPRNAAGHLQSLAAIANLARTRGLVERAARQRTRASLLRELRRYE